MSLFNNLINHFVGNSIMWLFYGGKKSIDEVAKTDNTNTIYKIVQKLMV